MFDSPVFTSCVGMNNKRPSHEIPFNEESGIPSLEESKDVLISESGKIVTRNGISNEYTGSFDSGFTTSETSFYAVESRTSDSALFLFSVQPDGSLFSTGVISGLPISCKFDYVKRGSSIVYCCGSQNGILNEAISSEIPDTEWAGPDKKRVMSKLPAGTHIDLLSGRILLSRANELYYDEHGLIGLFDEAKNRVRFGSDIIMICAVQDGAYISDTSSVYFVSGKNPNEWTCRKVLGYPAVEWSRVHGLVQLKDFGFESAGMGVMFGTVRGPVVGTSDGSCYNLIDDVYELPDCMGQNGFLSIVDKTMVIQG